MHWLDLTIIAAYLIVMLGIGFFFLRRQRSVDEYFVGDRKMTAGHIGLSVVATDVGGGFSIGLGGLGFAIGIAGSWLLFTGLIGAWLSAVILIPRVKYLGDKHKLLTFPDFLEKRFDSKTRLIAAVVSAIGYTGFVGSQILAGGKLSATAFDIDLKTAVIVMALVTVIYTSFGGLQAVIYTDTIQWIVLLGGLLFFALPFSLYEVGGVQALIDALPETHLSLTNITFLQFITWMFTIIPIWFIGMTLYQRIYATKDVKTAKRAWYIAGFLEWPTIAFLGVTLGMISRVMFPEVESEMGLPLVIKNVLPVGVVGIVMAAYFSAIMSTADSCLLASVGNVINDIYQKYINPGATEKRVLIISRILSLLLGLGSVSIALMVPKVLDAILLAYTFMVSGLFIPTIGGLLCRKVSSTAAIWSMLIGGGLSVTLTVFPALNPISEPILVALPVSLLTIIIISIIVPEKRQNLDFFSEENQ